MLSCRYSTSSPSFAKKLRTLRARYCSYLEKISYIPALKLPWWNADALFEKFSPLPKSTALVIIGIGGSMQGAKAVIEGHRAWNIGRKVVYIDNIDPDFVHSKLAALDIKKAFFVIISKSGETLETISLYHFVRSLNVSSRKMLFITDSQKDSPRTLERIAHELHAEVLFSASQIPGRFSIFSEPGLIPCALANIPVKELQEGARATAWRDAFTMACHQVLHYKEKRNICVVFSYAEGLGEFMNWYTQLLAESIGKSRQVGITPLIAMGARDQHSLLQLFLDGPDDKFYIFIKPHKSKHDIKLLGNTLSMQEIFDAGYKGVMHAFKKRKRPYVEISMPTLEPYHIGQLLFFFELEIAFIGALLQIDTSNQPGVELSKKYTKKMLNSH